MIVRAAIGAGLALFVASVAFKAHALTGRGAILAALMGTLAVIAGWRFGILLILFFVVSSALSRIGAARKAMRIRGIVEKRGARDARQVLANGGVFALSLLGFLVFADPAWSVAAVGALAAATADTWGTEIGGLMRGEPRLITTWRPVPSGTSGAVSAGGLAATLLGAGFIAGAAWSLGWPAAHAGAALAGGVAGALADSLVGATVQEKRRCDACAVDTEQRVHVCGAATMRIGGLAGLENDAVNLVSSAVGAVIAVCALAGSGGW